MERQRTIQPYAPTRLDADGVRHIISQRDGPSLCGVAATGEQAPPRDWPRAALCQRCLQKYVRELFSWGAGQGWEECA